MRHSSNVDSSSQGWQVRDGRPTGCCCQDKDQRGRTPVGRHTLAAAAVACVSIDQRRCQAIPPSHAERATAGSHPGLPHGGVEQLAALADVSVETAWNNGVIDGSDERRLISVWLCRHTKDQLHKLRSELNVTEGSSTMGREELAGCVLNAHRPGRPLPLPKRLNK